MLRLSKSNSGAIRSDKNPRTALAVFAFSTAALLGPMSIVSADTLSQPKTTALEDAAASYVRYREDVATIEATPFDKPSATREAHKKLAAHDPDMLTAGWVAYAALVAADTPEFVAALQKEVGGKKKRRRRGKLQGRDAFFAKLSEDPRYPRKLDGADAAIERVLIMTARDAHRFNKLGESFKTQAYAMQKTKWGKKRIASSSKRIGEASDYASSRPAPAVPTLTSSTNNGVTAPVLASATETWDYNWGEEGSFDRVNEPNAQAVIDRVLNLAARYAVGGINEKLVSVYAKNSKSQRCLSFAKLTLTQCIAATRTPYEEAFCLGEHGLNDIGSCIGWVAVADAG